MEPFNGLMNTIIALTPKSTKWIFLFNGLLNSAIGHRWLHEEGFQADWTSIIGLVLIVAGPLMLIYGALLFNFVSSLTPRVRVSESEILFKEDIHKPSRTIEWKDVTEVAFSSFELRFQLSGDRIEAITLPTNAETSIQIKKAIRQFADGRQIRVVGG
jgi:hypothetical protein